MTFLKRLSLIHTITPYTQVLMDTLTLDEDATLDYKEYFDNFEIFDTAVYTTNMDDDDVSSQEY